jgi:hypothetical protein
MKKIFTILTVVALTTTISFAQAQFGGVAGLNSSAIGSTESDDGLAFEEGRLGMHLGGVAHITLGDVMQLRTGLIYSQKGASDSETDGGYTTDVTFKLDYLEIPIEAAFVIGEVFALSAGPYIAFAMNKSVAIDTDVPGVDIAGQEELLSELLDEYVGGMDFGLNFGASYTIAETYMIGTKYSMGLTDILDEDLDPGDTDEIWINGCFSISFGYVFGN